MTRKFALLSFFVFSLSTVLSAVSVVPAQAAIELVKSKDFGTVYYIDGAGLRHPFPNELTYRSWYGQNFSGVATVSNDFLAQYPLGKNITVRPGTYLVKIRTAPQVYAVEQGGVLREIVSEEIARAIYGERWAQRVADVPDVFFDDYQIGEPLRHDYKVPENVLFQEAATKQYFYKKDTILQPFSSVQAILDNHFDLRHAVVSSRSFFKRERPITGFDRSVFNPVAVPITDARDCAATKLKAAVIFAVNDSYTTQQVEQVQSIKQAITKRFAWATNDLAQVDVSYPTSIVLDDGYLFSQQADGSTEVHNELITSFYNNNPDEFDFIIVWTNFKTPSDNSNEIASFIPVTNKLEGINRPAIDRSEVFGSSGKLKGVIMMGNISKYHPETGSGLNQALDYVLHEFLHQWAAYIEFHDATGHKSKALLREDDYQHWSYYAGFLSPLGGAGWVDNGDGTFTSTLSQLPDAALRPYSQLDLYLMGLIPWQLVDPVFYVEPSTPGAIGNTIAGTAKWVTIDQIIRASGQLKCSID